MEEEKKIQKTNINVKTFAEDMSEVIEGDREGLVRKIIHEQELREEEKRNDSPDSKKNKLFMLASFLLVGAALTALFIFVYNKESNTIPIQPQFTSLIYNDQTAFLEVAGLTKDQIITLVKNEIDNSSLKQGGVEGIYLTINKQIIGLRQFLGLTKSAFALDDLYFVSDNFLVGAVNKGEKSPFILLKMRSISDIFPNMRSWEPKMFSELHGLFGINIDQDTNYLTTKSFEDGVVDNKNARILYDNNHKPVLMYVYADDSSLVISNSDAAVAEIFSRLVASTIKK
jgi:hypothetical protein